MTKIEIGSVIGALTVVGSVPLMLSGGRKVSGWLCKCECGNVKPIRDNNLKTGNTVSCGCKRSHARLVHGHARAGMESLTYGSWSAMIDRCTNPNSCGYTQYAGRGIKVCERWKNFINFLEDMGERASPDITLDRFPDNDGNYEPGNCRWADKKQQRSNQRPRIQRRFRARCSECGAPQNARGLCGKHYMRAKNSGRFIE